MAPRVNLSLHQIHLTTSDVKGASKLPMRPVSDDSPIASLLQFIHTVVN